MVHLLSKRVNRGVFNRPAGAVSKAKRALFSDIPSSGIFRVADLRRCSEPMKSRFAVDQLGILLSSKLAAAVEVMCRSVRIKSRRDDVPPQRGRSCNQERALKRNGTSVFPDALG